MHHAVSRGRWQVHHWQRSPQKQSVGNRFLENTRLRSRFYSQKFHSIIAPSIIQSLNLCFSGASFCMSAASAGKLAHTLPPFAFSGMLGNYFKLVSEVTPPDTCFWAAGSSAPSRCMSRGGTHRSSLLLRIFPFRLFSTCVRTTMFISKPASAVIPAVKNEVGISHLVRGSH